MVEPGSGRGSEPRTPVLAPRSDDFGAGAVRSSRFSTAKYVVVARSVDVVERESEKSSTHLLFVEMASCRNKAVFSQSKLLHTHTRLSTLIGSTRNRAQEHVKERDYD